MVFYRFPDVETKRIVEYYLFCQPVREKATAEAIFSKINEFIEEEIGQSVKLFQQIVLQLCKAHRRVRIQQPSPNCVGIYCILHCKASVLQRT